MCGWSSAVVLMPYVCTLLPVLLLFSLCVARYVLRLCTPVPLPAGALCLLCWPGAYLSLVPLFFCYWRSSASFALWVFSYPFPCDVSFLGVCYSGSWFRVCFLLLSLPLTGRAPCSPVFVLLLFVLSCLAFPCGFLVCWSLALSFSSLVAMCMFLYERRGTSFVCGSCSSFSLFCCVFVGVVF